ncbi:hypothetical protein BDY19DRAFT_935398 [Irpex rosettiformis]|uniref:Uncharacterized protein n=1 Tax=Irpex rosettiformis TaxID=378272 RepID=A0ACB8UBD1_9APHY|nr:hypothetical protein BDY19DRAFT_935398 [Irpex rosettiformis]
MISALSKGHADLLGIGRLSVELPYLPRVLAESDGTIPPVFPHPISLPFPLANVHNLDGCVRSFWPFGCV